MHVNFEKSFVFVFRSVDVVRSKEPYQIIGLLELDTLRFGLVLIVEFGVFNLLIYELFKLVLLDNQFLPL